MTKSKNIIAGVVILVLAAVAAGVIVRTRVSLNGDSTVEKHVNARGEPWSLIKGSYFFKVSSAENRMPRFLSGSIDRLDVHVGDTQKMSVLLVSDAPARSVVAVIETDHGVKRVPLSLEGIKELDAKSVRQYTYGAQWKVVDTHNATYRTQFVAEGVHGVTDVITLAWSDPVCSFGSGTATINGVPNTPTTGLLLGSCTPTSGNEGVYNENIAFGGAYTLNLAGGTLLMQSGKSFNIQNGGSVVIGSGGSIQFGDSCPLSPTLSWWYPTSTPVACHTLATHGWDILGYATSPQILGNVPTFDRIGLTMDAPRNALVCDPLKKTRFYAASSTCGTIVQALLDDTLTPCGSSVVVFCN